MTTITYAPGIYDIVTAKFDTVIEQLDTALKHGYATTVFTTSTGKQIAVNPRTVLRVSA